MVKLVYKYINNVKGVAKNHTFEFATKFYR